MTTDKPLGRRRLLGTAGAALTAAAVSTPTLASAAPRAKVMTASASLRWLGTSGWRVDIAGKTVLVDPYLSRYRTGLFEGAFNPETRLQVDTAAVDRHTGAPQAILVTHTHWDHFNDVPHVAVRSGARVLGTLTAYHLGQALGIPAAQLSPVKGGEALDFGEFTVEAIASLHSRNGAYSMAFPGVRVAVPKTPKTIADLPEGDTLSYQITVKDGPSLFFMGASDFVERNVAGLRPDVAMLAMPSTDATFGYVPRLLAALDFPPVVVPVHWDIFEVPLENPPRTTPNEQKRLDHFVAAIREVAPDTDVLLPQYLTP